MAESIATLFGGGLLVALVGTLILFKAHGLATHWQMIRENAWGGTTEPSRENAYQWLGISLLVFGLNAVVVSLHAWLTLNASSEPGERRKVVGVTQELSD